MTSSLSDLISHNRAWAAQMERERPGFFTQLKSQQNPRYMLISNYGCSGVHAALENLRVGLADNWLRHIKDGLLQDLHITLDGIEGMAPLYRAAIAGVSGARR